MAKIKTSKDQVFYTVNGCLVIGGEGLGRGVFDFLYMAQDEADKWAEWEIWRHEDKRGVRVENKLLLASYAKILISDKETAQ